MGTVKSSASCRLHQYISDFKDLFTSGGKVLFSQACGKSVVPQQRSLVAQILTESKHVAAHVHLRARPGRKYLVGDSTATSSSSGPSKLATFATDICKAFVSLDITLFEINNPEV
jgi:hypothetical protein